MLRENWRPDMARFVFAGALALVILMSPAQAEEWKCPIEQYVCDANSRAFACYIEYGRRFDDSVTDVRFVARRIRIACDGLIERALARRWHAMRKGDPKALGIDEKWKIASAEFLRKEGTVFQERWYDEEIQKILSVIKQLRALRIKR